MTYISSVPKREDYKRVEAHLSPEEFEQFEALAKEKQWSNKKLCENIVREYLNNLNPKKKKK